MIHTLFKKLNLIFVSFIMIIITIVICIIQINDLNIQRNNEKSFLERMSTLIIYQINGDLQDYNELFYGYEERYQIFALLKDENGKVLYCSETQFETDNTTLLNSMELKMESSVSSQNFKNKKNTEQNGIVFLKGNHQDSYLAIPSIIALKEGTYNELILIYQQKATLIILREHLVFYFGIWIICLIAIIILSRFLIRKSLEPTEYFLNSQKNFIASASHELKSPLAVTSVKAETIGNLNLKDAEINKHTKVIDSECQRMSNLIQNMLILASSDAKTWTLQKSMVNIDTLLINCYESYETLCLQKGITLDLDLSHESYPVIYTDGERISQILGILMDNAIHYSFPNSSIQIQTEVSKSQITFFVVDHGKGILESDKPHIFERFYCADKSHTEKEHFGLGLSIAEELTKMLDGKIGLKDTIGGGCTFYISFTLKTK